jgi:transposase-like protein
MQKVQRAYIAEFKREAVRLLQTSGKPIAQVARDVLCQIIEPVVHSKEGPL